MESRIASILESETRDPWSNNSNNNSFEDEDDESEYSDEDWENSSESENLDETERKERRRRRKQLLAPVQVKDSKEIVEELCSEYRFLVNYGYFEPYFEWMPYEILIKIFENLNARDLLTAGLVCQRWLEATRFIKLSQKIQLHFQIFKFVENAYPMNRFMNTTRFFPNIKFSIVKFTPKNDSFWMDYGEIVEDLTFNSCIIMKPEFLRILRYTPYLKSLTIVRCEDLYKSWTVVKKLSQVKMRFKYLESLSIHETSMLTKPIFDFMLLSAPNLTSLTLANCLGNSKARDRVQILDSIVDFVSKFPKQIKKLNLNNTPHDDVFLEKLARIKDLELQELHLTFNGTVCLDYNKSGIVMLLRKQTKLKVLDLTDSRGLTNFCLIEICKNMKDLRKLILNKCWMINDVGLKEVSRLLNLEVLDISSCDRVTDLGLLEGLIPHGRKFFGLKELYLGLLPYMSILSVYRLSQQFDELKVLDLSGSSNCVTDEAIQMIFRYQSKLTYLNLDCCGKITDFGITGLADNSDNYNDYVPYTLNSLKKLEFLNLAGCYQITDKSLIKTFDHYSLRDVNLARCHNITEVGIKSMAKKCPLIESLDLSECFHITDPCVETITKDVTRLTTLKINGCAQVTDEILYAMKNNCKYLKNLFIRRCPKIKENPFEILKQVRYIYNQ